MGFSSVVAALILFAFISQMRAAVVLKIPGQGFERKVTTEKFKLHISERSVKFDEKIEIDEENDIEYFKVPPHNELSETDNMYDFKMNITVSRVNSDRVCHVSPLPHDLPRPNVLSKGLKMLTNLPPSHKIVKTIRQWRVGDIVNKWTLRPEVREFCGQFPVYRLEPFTADSVSVGTGDEGDTRAGRTRRVPPLRIDTYRACSRGVVPPCHPDQWLLTCKIKTSRCVYYITCTLGQINYLCSSVGSHVYDSLVCCDPSCPS